MKIDTHITAPARFVEATGIRYAYRRFGREIGHGPLGSPSPAASRVLLSIESNTVDHGQLRVMGIPGPPDTLPAIKKAYRYQLPADQGVLVRPVLGGLHHDYRLMPPPHIASEARMETKFDDVKVPDVIRVPRTDPIYNCHAYLTLQPLSGKS